MALLRLLVVPADRSGAERQEGIQEGEATLVLRLLTRRCGSLSEAQQAQVRALPQEQLEALGEALLEFTSRRDLDAWFEKGG